MQFILNRETITIDLPLGTTLLDFIRYHKHLKGTKIGCREGDCGACTVLIGEAKNGAVQYLSATSCLTPLGNVIGKHVVTVEGINQEQLTPVQQAMVDQNGTQCGFCTVGFVMALTANGLQSEAATLQSLIASIDGNICRCTGYKSIEKAAQQLLLMLNEAPTDRIGFAVEKGFVPTYFLEIPERLKGLDLQTSFPNTGIFVGGGTDLYVQKHAEMPHMSAIHLSNSAKLKSIEMDGDEMCLGGAVTVTEMAKHPEIQAAFEHFDRFISLISSTPIRNIATIAGNLVNASPIGDLSALFLALDATLVLKNEQHPSERTLKLNEFYLGYKQLAKSPEEYISHIRFKKPIGKVNFEKVSKRTYLDIASVNSAIQIEVQDQIINNLHLSFGGVFAYPFYAHQTIAFLKGKSMSENLLKDANQVLQSEIQPISDVRGTADYKRRLAEHLLYAHFIQLFNLPFAPRTLVHSP